MTTKVSKAQLEVWEWKEKLYEEIKNIPTLERLKYLNNKVSLTMKSLKTKKSIVA
jgi:hypothetical protein